MRRKEFVMKIFLRVLLYLFLSRFEYKLVVWEGLYY